MNNQQAWLYRIERVDRSPMNPKVWIVQLDCPQHHDRAVTGRKPRTTQRFTCEKCGYEAIR